MLLLCFCVIITKTDSRLLKNNKVPYSGPIGI